MRRYAATLALLLFPVACNPQAPKPAGSPTPGASPARTAPALHITGHGTAQQPVRIIQQIHNRVEYELIASSYESRGPQGKTRAVFQNATVTFHDKNGSTMKAMAPQAILDETSSSVTLVGDVRARTDSGMTLQCDRLVYDRGSEMLHGTGNVVIIDPQGFKASGSSFDSDVSLTHMRMK